MKFCEKCDNMFYIRVSEDGEKSETDAGDSLVYYCRNCGNSEANVIENICVSKIQIKKTDQKIMNTVNEFTKLDPTLPRLDNIPCPNEECPSNNDKADEKEVIYIRYDNTNLKFIYLCVHCDKIWRSS